MKRELKVLRPRQDECCPGHDKWPNQTYRNKRSKKARSRGIRKEHKYVRTLVKRLIRGLIRGNYE